MEDKTKYYSKITDEDIGIAEQFFDNDKHLDEFLANVSRYYSQRNLTIKTKIVQKYFTAYKKTMDFVLNARGTGSKGGIKAAENQTIKSDTLLGGLNNPSDTLAVTLIPNINSKVISNKDKEIIVNNKESKKVFTKPTLIDCENIFIQKTAFNWTEWFAKNEAAIFFNFYESKDWMVGKNKMKNLNGAIGGWVARTNKSENTKSKSNTTNSLIENSNKIRPIF